MKPNSSTANRTSVRVQSSPRSHRSAAASRGSETLCRPSLPTAEAGTAACAATAKWCADSANAPTAAMHGPSVAADAGRVSAASANASTCAAVQTPTPAAADVAPAGMTTSDNEPSATSAQPFATPCATTKKPSAADVAPAAMTTSGNGPSATPARASAIDGAAAKKPAAAHVAPAGRTTSGDGPSAAPARPSATDGAAAKKTSAPHIAPAARTTSGDGPSAAPARPSAIDSAAAKKLSAAAGALSAEQRAAAVAAGVVLRSADDRTALFTQWLAPHLPMVRGLVRRHTYFAGERADDYQTAVLHLLEHLDDLAHFALCLTARRDTAKPRAATANCPSPADEPSAQPTTPPARDFDETHAAVDESAIYTDERAPYLYAATAEINESQCGGDETRPADDEEALREVDETAVGFDETAAEDEVGAAAEDERQPYADAALEGSERHRAPLPVTAEEVLHTVGDFNPRPWLAGVTLRLLSTLNHRALRHRETHLTPASADSDELFDPADPNGDLWSVGADPATAGAQRQAAPSRWEETLGAGRERSGGSAGVTTRDAAATRAAQAAAAHSATADSAAPSAGAEEATAAGGGPTATGEWARSAVDNCLECWHREQPRRGFHRTRGGRLWNAMRARAQQAHSAFAYRAVLRAEAAEALAAQPLRDRALVLLTADGWTAEEIGLAVGASPTAVRQTVCRVRMRLRRWRRAWAHRTHATRAL